MPAHSTVAQFYDNGMGVEINYQADLYWYKSAYKNGKSWHRQAQREGASVAANNIGCIMRDMHQEKEAISWFRRAVKLGDGDANLNIAKIYLRSKRDRQKAIRYLQRTCRAPYVTDGSIEEAKALLKQLRKTKLDSENASAKSKA